MGYLYVLEVVKNENVDDDWSGKINATNALIKDTSDSVIARIELSNKNCSGHVKKLNKEVGNLDKEVKEMRSLLE